MGVTHLVPQTIVSCAFDLFFVSPGCVWRLEFGFLPLPLLTLFAMNLYALILPMLVEFVRVYLEATTTE